MPRNLIALIGLTVSVLLLSGCIDTSERDTTKWEMDGKVTRIIYDDAFGGTFTDWQDIIFFEDGNIFYSQGRDLSSIIINKTGTFYFERNHFNYEGVRYKFDNFIRVEYYDDEI